MGQSVSREVKKVVPEWLKNDLIKVHVEVKKDFVFLKKELNVVKDVALINYDSLREIISSLNCILKSCCNDTNEKVLFGLQTAGQDLFWKTHVKIICFKINTRERLVSVTRYMTLHQFWKLRADLLREIHYKELIDENSLNGFEFVEHPPEGDEEIQENRSESNDEVIEEELELPQQLTVSTVLDRVNQVGRNIEDDECLICMANKVEVSLPCAHSFCAKCINMWNAENPSCPTCREKIQTPEEFWEFTDMPNIDQMNKHLLALATGT